VVRAVRRRFDTPSRLSFDDAHLERFRVYTGDMLVPFGLNLGPYAHRGQSYGEMAASLLADLLPEGETADLLILVHAVHDIMPGRATATYLSHVCPGGPLAFAICDQGTAGPFTALRLAREYARGGDARRAVILIVEQALLPYDTGTSPVPAGHTGVALLTGDRPVALVTDIAVRADEVDGAGMLIASPAAAKRLSPLDNVVVAPEDQPYTGVWWETAAALGKGRFTVVDFDEQLGYLSALRIGDHSSSSTV
jgi:4-hydroxymandelate oxidase